MGCEQNLSECTHVQHTRISSCVHFHSAAVCFTSWNSLCPGRYKLAEQDLTKALEIKPDFSDALKNLEQVRRDLQNGHKFNQADKFVQLEEKSAI